MASARYIISRFRKFLVQPPWVLPVRPRTDLYKLHGAIKEQTVPTTSKLIDPQETNFVNHQALTGGAKPHGAGYLQEVAAPNQLGVANSPKFPSPQPRVTWSA